MSYNMSVQVTLVFACEAHRETWLKVNALSGEAKHNDYNRRKGSQNLTYTVGPMTNNSFAEDHRRIAQLKHTLQTALEHLPKADWAILLAKLSPEMRVMVTKMINEGILGACPDPEWPDCELPF